MYLQKQNNGLVMINFYKPYIDCAPTNTSGNISTVAGKLSFIIPVCGGVTNTSEFILGEGVFLTGIY